MRQGSRNGGSSRQSGLTCRTCPQIFPELSTARFRLALPPGDGSVLYIAIGRKPDVRQSGGQAIFTLDSARPHEPSSTLVARAHVAVDPLPRGRAYCMSTMIGISFHADKISASPRRAPWPVGQHTGQQGDHRGRCGNGPEPSAGVALET
jgi:hypothetical protein